MRSFSTGLTAMAVALLGLAVVQSTSAQKIEGFEPGDPALTTGGDASVRGTTEGIAPTEGVNQLVLTSISSNDGSGLAPYASDALAHPGLQNFYNAINATATDNITLSDSEGSGAYFQFTLAAPATITFNYDFLTNETSSSSADRAIAILYNGAIGAGTATIGGVQTITTSASATTVLPTGVKFAFHTAAGYGNTFSINIAAAGTYTLALGVFDISPGNADQNSALLVDNIRIVPEPSAIALGFAGTLLLIGLRRRLKRA